MLIFFVSVMLILTEDLWPNRANLKKVDLRGVVLSMHGQLHINDFFSPLQKNGAANAFVHSESYALS